MKAMDSLLALSVLATLGAGAANAATVTTYDVAVTPLNLIYHFPQTTDTGTGEITNPAHDADILLPSSHGISGSAVLDDSGTLTITSSYEVATLFGTDTTFGNVVTVHGSWVGGNFTAASASQHLTSCADNVVDPSLWACLSSGLRLNVELSLADVTGSTNSLSGGFVTTQSFPNSYWQFQYVLSNGTPAVPVPAAAWLFASGLLGVFGAARRRPA